MTCDHNCVIMTGLTFDITSSVCRDVINEIRTRGDGWEESWKREERGADCPRARDKVCLSDDNPFDADEGTVAWLFEGEIGKCGVDGEDVLLRLPGEECPPFRFPEKGRRNDHSDSNWMVSDSEPKGA